MSAEVLREANAEVALLKAQVARATIYLSLTAGTLTLDVLAKVVSELADGIESLAKAVLGLEDTPPPDLRVIYGEGP